MDILQVIADELQIKKGQVEKSVELIDEGATIPFIARYRKEVTGSLNDEQLRALSERLVYLRNLEEKKASVLATIEEQGKLTEDLSAAIDSAKTLAEVEDLYRPYNDGSIGGSVPSIPSKASDKSDNRQGEGLGTTCRDLTCTGNNKDDRGRGNRFC